MGVVSVVVVVVMMTIVVVVVVEKNYEKELKVQKIPHNSSILFDRTRMCQW